MGNDQGCDNGFSVCQQMELSGVFGSLGVLCDQIGHFVKRCRTDCHREGKCSMTGRKWQFHQPEKSEVNEQGHQQGDTEQNGANQKRRFFHDAQITGQRKAGGSGHDRNGRFGGIRDFTVENKAVDHEWQHDQIACQTDSQQYQGQFRIGLAGAGRPQ